MFVPIVLACLINEGNSSARSAVQLRAAARKISAAEEPKKGAAGSKKEQPEKKLTDPITIMRGELCWTRHNLIRHDSCMEWLVEECTTVSFGTGLCNRVSKRVKQECQSTDKDHSDKACDYAKQLGIDVRVDTDGDGVVDEEDAFPKDPAESKDTDGDGVGDNADECPEDPKYTKKPCKEPETTTVATTTTVAPAPAPAKAAPAPAKEEPAPAGVKEAPAPAKEEKEEKEAPAPAKEAAPAPAEPAEKAKEYEDPDAKKGLQSQGFRGKLVKHEDGETATSDWGKEYGNEPEKRPKRSGAELSRMHPVMMCVVAALASSILPW